MLKVLLEDPCFVWLEVQHPKGTRWLQVLQPGLSDPHREALKAELEKLEEALPSKHLLKFSRVIEAGTGLAMEYQKCPIQLDLTELLTFGRQPEGLNACRNLLEGLFTLHREEGLMGAVQPHFIVLDRGQLVLSGVGYHPLLSITPELLPPAAVEFQAPECRSGQPMTVESDLFSMARVLGQLVPALAGLAWHEKATSIRAEDRWSRVRQARDALDEALRQHNLPPPETRDTQQDTKKQDSHQQTDPQTGRKSAQLDPVETATHTHNTPPVRWNAANLQLTHTLTGHQGYVLCAALNGKGLVATGSSDQTVRVWDLRTGGLLHTFSGQQHDIEDLNFYKEGTLLMAISRDRTTRVWDLKSGQFTSPYPGKWQGVLCRSFRLDLQKVVLGHLDGTIEIRSLTLKILHQTLKGHQGPVRAVAFSPDGTLLLSGGRDHTAKLWDLKTGLPIHTFQHHTGTVRAVAFSPDGTMLATAGSDRAVCLYQTTTGQLLTRITGHQGEISSIQFHAEGDLILTASHDHTARLWTVAGDELAVLSHQRWVNVALFSDHQVITCSDDRTVKIWSGLQLAR